MMPLAIAHVIWSVAIFQFANPNSSDLGWIARLECLNCTATKEFHRHPILHCLETEIKGEMVDRTK